jgi:Na+-driven multidrug efflux pump
VSPVEIVVVAVVTAAAAAFNGILNVHGRGRPEVYGSPLGLIGFGLFLAMLVVAYKFGSWPVTILALVAFIAEMGTIAVRYDDWLRSQGRARPQL